MIPTYKHHDNGLAQFQFSPTNYKVFLLRGKENENEKGESRIICLLMAPTTHYTIELTQYKRVKTLGEKSA